MLNSAKVCQHEDMYTVCSLNFASARCIYHWSLHKEQVWWNSEDRSQIGKRRIYGRLDTRDSKFRELLQIFGCEKRWNGRWRAICNY